jgi:hypothetical protein
MSRHLLETVCTIVTCVAGRAEDQRYFLILTDLFDSDRTSKVCQGLKLNVVLGDVLVRILPKAVSCIPVLWLDIQNLAIIVLRPWFHRRTPKG